MRVRLKSSEIWPLLVVIGLASGPFAGAGAEPMEAEASPTVYVVPPAEGTRLALDDAPDSPIYRLQHYGPYPLGTLRPHDAVLLDAWEGDQGDAPAHALSTKSGLLIGTGESGFSSMCHLCSDGLKRTLFHADMGAVRLQMETLFVLRDLAESAFWGHTLSEGDQWDLPVRQRGSWQYTGNVSVDLISSSSLEVTLKSAVRFVTHTRSSSTYEAHLVFDVVDGMAGPFATNRTMTETSRSGSPGERTWWSTVNVVEEGAGPVLPFEASRHDDVWPPHDATMDHGVSIGTPYDPRPHPFFDVARLVQVVLAYPSPQVESFLAGGELQRVSNAKLSLSQHHDLGWPPHEVLYVGGWSVDMCNDRNDVLTADLVGVQPREGPFVPVLTSFGFRADWCVDGPPAEHAALGDVLRAVEGLEREGLWQPQSFSYSDGDGGSRATLDLYFDHPRLHDDKSVQILLNTPIIERATAPNEDATTRVVP